MCVMREIKVLNTKCSVKSYINFVIYILKYIYIYIVLETYGAN